MPLVTVLRCFAEPFSLISSALLRDVIPNTLTLLQGRACYRVADIPALFGRSWFQEKIPGKGGAIHL